MCYRKITQINQKGELVRLAGFEPATYGLAYHYRFPCQPGRVVCGLDHIFTISGAAHMASTDPYHRKVCVL
ncbi:hypothetical protein [Desulfonema magnum]|uniref:hypothetical protein n=1 Tax=Desulfonema magnum TaxID=45655 RepID=UPI001A9C224A|nr:hypothetical protein [Desulfonema magnum]